jgi:signal peptidase I
MANNPLSTPRPAKPPAGLPVAPDPGTISGEDKPHEHKDVVREVLETIVFVVVLVLMLKTFVAEAFVIPTGSMAETLYGYQKLVTCTDCGYSFPVNCSSEVDPQDRMPVFVDRCTCPNCQHKMQWKETGGPEWGSGDRVLVAKYLFDSGRLWTPKRHQVIVFKFPESPQRYMTAMNYIKRCMGLPDETIAIVDGDLYVSRGKFHFDDTSIPNKARPEVDLWRPQFLHFNDDAAVNHFAESVKRHIAGKSLPGDFEIVRTPPDVMLAEKRLVFDNDFQPASQANRIQRWEFSDATRWASNNGTKPTTFTHTGKAGENSVAWLRYGHRVRQNFPTGRLDPDLQAFGKQIITNHMGYNSGNGDSRPQELYSWVPDLMLEAKVEVSSANGEFVFELSKGIDRFQAKFDVAAGTCTLFRVTGLNPQGAKLSALGSPVPSRIKGPGSYHIRFANFNERLTVWVGRHLIFGDGIAYPPALERGPTKENDLEPASIGVAGGTVTVSALKLWRDTHYTYADHPVTTAELDFANKIRIQTLYVQPGHYLALGDNSAQSADSRTWGLVPERLLLGRALVVYYPFWPFVTQTRAGLIH